MAADMGLHLKGFIRFLSCKFKEYVKGLRQNTREHNQYKQQIKQHNNLFMLFIDMAEIKVPIDV